MNAGFVKEGHQVCERNTMTDHSIGFDLAFLIDSRAALGCRDISPVSPPTTRRLSCYSLLLTAESCRAPMLRDGSSLVTPPPNRCRASRSNGTVLVLQDLAK